MNFFFQEVKGQKTLLITSTRLRITRITRKIAGGIWEHFWVGGDLGHLACPKCVPRNTNDSGFEVTLLSLLTYVWELWVKEINTGLGAAGLISAFKYFF